METWISSHSIKKIENEILNMRKRWNAENKEDVDNVVLLDDDEQQMVIDTLKENVVLNNKRWISIFRGICVFFILGLIYIFFSDCIFEEEIEAGKLKHLVDILSFPKYSQINVVFVFVSNFESFICSLVCTFISTKMDQFFCFIVGIIPPVALFFTSYFIHQTFICFHLFIIGYNIIILLATFTLANSEKGLLELEQLKYKHKKV